MIMTSLRQYLEFFRQHAYMYDWMLKYGTFFVPQALTDEERAYVLKIAKKTCSSFELGECYYNAQLMALADKTERIKYVEGLATKFIPMLHGWNTINGKVIDLTWREEKNAEKIWLDNRVWGEFAWEYVGVEFPRSYVRRIHLRDHYAKSLLDDPVNDYPILKLQEAPNAENVPQYRRKRRK